MSAEWMSKRSRSLNSSAWLAATTLVSKSRGNMPSTTRTNSSRVSGRGRKNASVKKAISHPRFWPTRIGGARRIFSKLSFSVRFLIAVSRSMSFSAAGLGGQSSSSVARSWASANSPGITFSLRSLPSIRSRTFRSPMPCSQSQRVGPIWMATFSQPTGEICLPRLTDSFPNCSSYPSLSLLLPLHCVLPQSSP